MYKVDYDLLQIKPIKPCRGVFFWSEIPNQGWDVGLNSKSSSIKDNLKIIMIMILYTKIDGEIWNFMVHVLNFGIYFVLFCLCLKIFRTYRVFYRRIKLKFRPVTH